MQRTRLNFILHFVLPLLCLCLSAVSSCRFTVQTARYCYCTVLFGLTDCYIVSTVYKYRLYHSIYRYLCALNILVNILSLNISIKYCCHNWEVWGQCCHFYVTSHGGWCWQCCLQVKCFKLLHRVPAVDRLTVELLGLLARVDVSCIVLCGNVVCCWIAL